MKVRASSVDEALSEWLWRLKSMDLKVELTRNGPVYRIPDVCITEFVPKFQRVSLCPVRDANPFFHFFEALWILAGRSDVEFVAQFNPRMREFSDDDITFAGSYGRRYGQHLPKMVSLLSGDPATRRAIIAGDVGLEGKDVPCNFAIHFLVEKGSLNLYVFNRSNDLIWGLCGANAVHFSYILEYVARSTGLPRGNQVHISSNLHLYTELPGQRGLDMLKNLPTPPVYRPTAFSVPLCSARDAGFFRSELLGWLDNMDRRPGSEYLGLVAYPAWLLWKEHKAGNPATNAISGQIADPYWAMAMHNWIQRRRAQ